MADVNRSAFLPAQIAKEILTKTQENSAVMALARQINLPGTGVAVPVIMGDPSAAWVGETGSKTVSNSNVVSKLMQPYKLAVIETVSMELTRDADALYAELVKRLPLALAKKFDNTVIGGTAAPGSNFDSLSSATAQDIATATYDGLCAAEADIAAHDGLMNGIALAPQGKSLLLAAKDGNDRPLFINNVSEGAVPMVLGAKTVMNKGLFKSNSGTHDIVGIAGDWTQAVYGTVEGIKISVSDQATLDVGSGNTINLWQQNMVAIRAEIEVGFRADKGCFNLLTN